ncbi:MAG TPA: hypothetical protein VNR91_08820 [Sphingomonas sp.]|nr:hypothetical protein [Sphingomonas sp.]
MQRTVTASGHVAREARGHPFRRSLRAPAIAAARNEDNDLKLFVLSFTAFFVCFYTFLM